MISSILAFSFAQATLGRPLAVGEGLYVQPFGCCSLGLLPVRIQEDGTANLPLLGRVEVAGLSLDQVSAKLRPLFKAKGFRDSQYAVPRVTLLRVTVVGPKGRVTFEDFWGSSVIEPLIKNGFDWEGDLPVVTLKAGDGGGDRFGFSWIPGEGGFVAYSGPAEWGCFEYFE